MRYHQKQKTILSPRQTPTRSDDLSVKKYQIMIEAFVISMLVVVHPDFSHTNCVFTDRIVLVINSGGRIAFTKYVPYVRTGQNFKSSPAHPDLKELRPPAISNHAHTHHHHHQTCILSDYYKD